MYNNPVEVFETNNWQDKCKSIQEELGLTNPLVITSKGTLNRHNLSSLFEPKSIFSDIKPDPTFSSCQNAIDFIDISKFNGVIAIGGGSVMDTAKTTMACLGTGISELSELLTITKPFNNIIPSIFLPTTHGTGGEVTMWGTIWNIDEKKKYSISHPDLYPTVAILDANLTLSLPFDISLNTSMDALSHSFEAIWNNNRNNTSTALAIEAISLIISNIENLKESPNNLLIRKNLLTAANKAGLAFSNTKTAAAHSISYPLTMHYGVAHGIAASISLPWLLEINRDAIDKDLKTIFSKLNIKSFVELKDLLIKLVFQDGNNRLKNFGIKKEDLNWLVNQSYTKGRMENNIVELTNSDIREILEKSF